MTEENLKDQQTRNPNEGDCQNCRTRVFVGTDLFECLMEPLKCQWVMPYGNGNFCKHPSAKQFVKYKQP